MKTPSVVRFRFVVSLCGSALLLAVVGWSGANTTVDLLSGASFLEHVRVLASDELEGRGNGSRGIEKAARYIGSQFWGLGLRGAGDEGTYYQSFTMGSGRQLGPKNRLDLEGAGIEGELRLYRDFVPLTFSAAADVEAPIVFAGYGVTAPEYGYDDYEGLDARGAVVLIVRRVPRGGARGGPFDSDSAHATFAAKVANAKVRGASALLFINDGDRGGGELDTLLDFGTDLGVEVDEMPALHLKRRLGEALLTAAGRSLALVQKEIDERLRPSSFELNAVRARIRVDVLPDGIEGKNVLGYLPPAATDGDEELVVIGAHYDHVGLGYRHSRARLVERGEVHNGADDNASGTAGLLELARVFSKRTDLTRGILFAAFAGEELGLLGSSHYAENPTLPLPKTVAMLNMDMIGRLRDGKLYVGGVSSSPVFEPKLRELAAAHALTLSFRFSLENRSDNASFSAKEVPSLFFFTGLHDDYHRPSDDWERLDPVGAERVLRVIYLLTEHLLTLPERPAFVRSDSRL